jgi:hypothetical protein
MVNEWDGVGKRGVLRSDIEQQRDALANAARRYDWTTVVATVQSTPALANAIRPGSTSGFAPLHQVAHGGGPPSVAMALIAQGAWRTLRNLDGERPIDVARRRGHDHLEPVLTPIEVHHVPDTISLTIERNFHAVIRGRIGTLEQESRLRLPQLAPMLEVFGDWWFPVPGMYGGFRYSLALKKTGPALLSESWCRVVEGSEERHEIDVHDSRLLPQEPSPSGLRIVRKSAGVPDVSHGE